MVNRFVFAAPSAEYLDLSKSDMADAGGKGAGLMRIPPDWYPPTVVIAVGLHELFGAAADIVLADLEKLLADDGLGHALSRLAEHLQHSRVLVRSSALDESIAERGTYETFAAQPDIRSVAERIQDIWLHAERLGIDARIGALIQPEITVKLAGHMSNEHRISRESYTWLATFSAGSSQSAERWRVSGDQGVDDGALSCSTMPLLAAQLRRVANWFSSKPTRYHLEWVWDGDRLWIVQADPVEPVSGKSPGDCWIPPRAHDVTTEALSCWKSVAGQLERTDSLRWRKLESVREFHRADLPVPNVWILEGAGIIEELSQGGSPTGLMNDLADLCAGHLVVRVDVGYGFEGLMLPKTDGTNDPAEILGFLRSSATSLISDGVPPSDICFIAHRYIRARASAWTFSSPDRSVVTIDSCWGLADGMNWLPHDRFDVNVDGATVQRSIVGKPSLYDVLEDRSWGYRDTPSEWIWRSSMSEQQIMSVAQGAKRLATLAGEPVLTMWFIGLLDGADVDCLPWFQNHEIPADYDHSLGVSQTAKRMNINGRDDLEKIEKSGKENEPPKVLVVSPISNFVRDRSFVEDIINIAKLRGLAIELEGSPLCHPFYLFQRAGIPVSCKNVRDPKPVPFGKLVRDAIPDLIASKGESVVSYRAAPPEVSRLLKMKLLEESMELYRSNIGDAMLEEIADLLEVVDALRINAGLTLKSVSDRRKAKRESRGGFSEARVLVETRPKPGGAVDSDQLTLPGLSEAVRKVANWQVQLDGDRLSISSIPPLPDEPASFVVETANGTNLAVDYTSDGIIVTVNPRAVRSDQVSLF